MAGTILLTLISTVLAAPASAMEVAERPPHVVDITDDSVVRCDDGLTVDGSRVASSCADADIRLNVEGNADLRFDAVELRTVRIDGNGTIAIRGELDADAISGNAVNYEVDARMTAHTIDLRARASAQLSSTAALEAHQVYLSGTSAGVALSEGSSVAASGTNDPTVTLRGQTVSAFGTVTATDRDGSGPGIVVEADPIGGAVFVSGEITATSTTGVGGTVAVTGESVVLLGDPANADISATIDVSGPRGGGVVVIGGGHRGEGPFDNAVATYIAEGAQVHADATVRGTGGDVSIWADDESITDGLITARGGPQGGDGGLIEVSAGVASELNGTLDVTAPRGIEGSVLLDPLFYAVLPDGLLTAFTAVDDIDAAVFLSDFGGVDRAPDFADTANEFLPLLFCDIADLGCVTPSVPTVSYRMPINHVNTIIDFLTSERKNPSEKLRQKFKKTKPRKWVSFLSKSTLEQFTGDIDVESLFGITLLHGVTDLTAFGIPGTSVGGTLDLSKQGPGETVRFATPYNVTSNGAIVLGGGHLHLNSGMAVDRAYIESKFREILGEDESWVANALGEYDMEQLIQDAFTEVSNQPTTKDEILSLTEFADVMCGNCVHPAIEPAVRVSVSPHTKEDLDAFMVLYDQLGIGRPVWYTNFINKINYVDNWANRLPGFHPDLTHSALHGVHLPAIPGIVVPSACITKWVENFGCAQIGTGIVGELANVNPEEICKDVVSTVIDFLGIASEVTETVCSLACPGNVLHGGECWITPPVPPVAAPWVSLCNGEVFDPAGACDALEDATNLAGICQDSVSVSSCNLDTIVNEVVLPPIRDVVLRDLPPDYAAFNDYFGSLPTWPFPEVNLNPLPSLLYVDGPISNPAGVVTLDNDSFTSGHVVITDTITANQIAIEAADSDFINRTIQLRDLLGSLSFTDLPAGQASGGTLQAITVRSETSGGFGETVAPIRIAELAGPVDLDITNHDSGGVHLGVNGSTTLTGTVVSQQGHVSFVSPTTLNMGTLEVLAEDHTIFVNIDGGTVTAPVPRQAELLQVTGLEKNDSVSTGFHVDVPVVVDLGDGDDTLTVVAAATLTHGRYGTIELEGFEPITYTGVENIVGIAPTLAETSAPATIAEGAPWTVNVPFTDWGASSWTIDVDWGDGVQETTTYTRTGTEPTAPAVTHAYADNGTYTATITVTDSQDNMSSTTTKTVNVTNEAPTTTAIEVASIDENAVLTLQPSFADPGLGDTHEVVVSWGDGTAIPNPPQTETSPGNYQLTASHSYVDEGTFVVETCVTDDDGAEHCDETEVTVNNVAPVVVSGAPQTLDEGQVFTLNTAHFTDPGRLDTHTASIDWSDGTIDEPTLSSTPFEVDGITEPAVAGATGYVTATHGYTDNGVYSVRTCVIDNSDDEGCSAVDITVNNVVPVLPPLPDIVLDEGERFELAAPFVDQGAGDTHVATIDWGDGRGIDQGIIDPGPANAIPGLGGTISGHHAFHDNGDYVVEVCLADDDAPDALACQSFTASVQNVLPTAPMFEQQSDAAEGAAHLLGTLTFNDQGQGDVITATVDWGDGDGPEPIMLVGKSNISLDIDGVLIPTPHTYVDDGIYTVTVCVADDDAPDDHVCSSIDLPVANVAPTELQLEPLMPIIEGDILDVGTLGFADAGLVDTHTVTIDWGDESPTERALVDELEAQFALHRYTNDGDFTVTICVRDDDDGETCIHPVLAVTNVEPTYDFSTSASRFDEGDVLTVYLKDIFDPGSDALTADILWGDGTGETVTVTDSEATVGHRYRDNGSYEVTACVLDDDASVCNTQPITVDNVAPSASVVQEHLALAGLPTQLNLEEIVEPGADQLQVEIDWGDGAQETLTTGVAGLTLTHDFANPGTYDVTVCILDDDGGRACLDRIVDVHPVPELLRSLVEDSNANSTFTEGVSEQSEERPNSLALAGLEDPPEYSIDWGDGSPVDTFSDGDDLASADHEYEDDGEYTVTMCATDSSGELCTDAIAVVDGSPRTIPMVVASVLVFIGLGWTARRKIVA